MPSQYRSSALALPIARRELLVLSRAGSTWKSRLGISFAVFLFGIVLASTYHYGGQFALNMVVNFLGVGLSWLCLFTGLSLTADAIAEEKRGGTLGLLFLTHLSSSGIVLGKLVAHGVIGFYTTLCALPLLSMSMIFGGMRLTDVLLYLAWALNVLFFSAAVGLFASSICRDKRRASGLATLIVVFFWLGLPMLALLLNAIGSPQPVSDAIARLSVNLSASTAFIGRRILPSTSSTPWSLAWTHILGWLFLGLTVWLLPRRWQDAPPRKRLRLRELWKAIALGRPATRLRLRRRLLDRNPFLWLASRDRLQTMVVWIITAAALAFCGFLLWQRALIPDMLLGITVAIAIVQQGAFSGAAGAQLFREYEQGTLEMVLSTPLSVHEVIRGQLAAALRQYRLLIALTFLLLWVGIIWLMCRPGAPLSGIIISIVSSVLFLLQFYAIAWVGMWAIVKAPDPRRASAAGMFYVTILPLIIFGVINAAVQFFNWVAGIGFFPGVEFWVPLLFILAFGNYIYWLRRAQRELPNELRQFAFRRYTLQEHATVFGQLGRLMGRWLHATYAGRSPS